MIRARLPHPVAGGLVVVTILALWAWRSQLFTVSRPGDRPRPLAVQAEIERRPARFDVVLPAVPAGMERVRPGGHVLLVHYWAPWERHSANQVVALDSLRRLESFTGLRVIVVCFDPFPSVARYVARQRLRLAVLLDTQGEMRRGLPCPSVPYTYVFDTNGRMAVAQAGEVDWLAPVTRAALETLLEEDTPERAGARGEPL